MWRRRARAGHPSRPSGRCNGIATPVDVSLWVRAYASTSASRHRHRDACPGTESMTAGSLEVRRGGDRGGELRARTRRSSGAGCVARSGRRCRRPRTRSCRRCRARPRSRRAGRTARRARCAARRPRIERCLAVAGAQSYVAGRLGQRLDGLGPHLRGPRAEPPVAGEQVGGDADARSGVSAHQCATIVACMQRDLRSALRPSRESATLAVDAKAKALKAAGEHVIGFGAGEPDFPTPAHIVEAAVEACRDPKNHKYTPDSGGLPELREAIAAKTARDSGYEVAASQVLVTNGGKHAVYNTFATLLDPGDEALLPAPYWTTYPEADRAGRRDAGRAPDRRGDRLQGHRRAARGGTHRPHQAARVRVAVEPVRRGVPARRGRGHRPVGGRTRHLGRHRRDLRAPHLRRASRSTRCRWSCPSWPTAASWSTAWPRPTP